MPEANATVDPFDSAGVRLPTEGKGYSGTDSATQVAIAASFGVALPANNVLPGPQTFVAVDIPFAAEGEVIELEYGCGFVPDNSNVTPATFVAILPVVFDAASVPFSASLQSGISTSEPVALALTDFPFLTARTAFEVPAGIVFPLTVALLVFADGDALIGDNQTVGINPAPANLLVQRVKRERVLQMPPQNLI
jgi:hypothetical protein